MQSFLARCLVVIADDVAHVVRYGSKVRPSAVPVQGESETPGRPGDPRARYGINATICSNSSGL